jgi:hypothetical protein
MSGGAPDVEYADYADQIGEMLRGRCTVDELANWLIEAELAMRLQPDDHDGRIDLDVAGTVIAWYERVSLGDTD